MHRFMLEFSRIETLAGVRRTVYNQYDSLVRPMQAWLQEQGVHLVNDCKVTSFDHAGDDVPLRVTAIHCLKAGTSDVIAVSDRDFVFMQNGSMTDASSLGSMTRRPAPLTKADSGGWKLWEALAEGRPAFGSCIAQSCSESFTVTLKDAAFFDEMKLEVDAAAAIALDACQRGFAGSGRASRAVLPWSAERGPCGQCVPAQNRLPGVASVFSRWTRRHPRVVWALAHIGCHEHCGCVERVHGSGARSTRSRAPPQQAMESPASSSTGARPPAMCRMSLR